MTSISTPNRFIVMAVTVKTTCAPIWSWSMHVLTSLFYPTSLAWSMPMNRMMTWPGKTGHSASINFLPTIISTMAFILGVITMTTTCASIAGGLLFHGVNRYGVNGSMYRAAWTTSMTTAKTVAIMSVLLFALKHCSDENTSIIVDNFNVIHRDKKPLTDQRFFII